MKKVIYSLLIMFFIPFIVISQQGSGGSPKGVDSFYALQVEIPTYKYPKPDIDKLREEDRMNDSLQLGPWRFGFNYAVNLNLNNSGRWITTEKGDKIWMLKISSEEAKSINLAFSETRIPKGNELYVYSPNQSVVLGKFTQNHIYEGELGTELIAGDEVVVEYFIPYYNVGIPSAEGEVLISRLTYGYRTSEEFEQKIFGSSGDCNMNVNCPDGAPFVNQRNSVVMLISNGGSFCSGALINNTNYDGKPYVLTANHCYNSNVTNWVFRFNWESETCENPGESPSFNSLSGAVLRARRQPSDFLLVEITGGLENGTVPQAYNPYFAGWNRGDVAPDWSYSISHPKGDIKKLSIDDDPAIASQGMGSQELNSSWRVIWDRNTITEGGSSGAPLFNHKGKIIGQLWGGNSKCVNAGTNDAYDYFGRLYNSWEPNGSDSTKQLKYWLDPNEENYLTIEGYNPYSTPLQYDVLAGEIWANENNPCESSFIPKFTLTNLGSEVLTSTTLTYNYNGSNGTLEWSGSLNTYQSVTIDLPLYLNQNGLNTITVTASNPNGNQDMNVDNNSSTVSFTANPNGGEVRFDFYMDCWPQENSWDIVNEFGEKVLEGGNYPIGSNSLFHFGNDFCLASGCYTLTIYDDSGDGVGGASYPSCDYNGYMTLINPNTLDTLAYLPQSEANFGDSRSFEFCIEGTQSIELNSMVFNVLVYPNPAVNTFTIFVENEGEKTIELTNSLGERVGFYKITGKTLQIDTQNFSSGVYFVSISNSQGKVVKKIVIE